MAKTYQKDDLTIVWKPDLCIHSEKCVHGLPTVFRPKESPWIQPEHGDKETLRTVVMNCPSGALSLVDSGEVQAKPEAVKVTFIENGPLILQGTFSMSYKGEETSDRPKISLCRCGASANKPLCDGSHKAIGFQD